MARDRSQNREMAVGRGSAVRPCAGAATTSYARQWTSALLLTIAGCFPVADDRVDTIELVLQTTDGLQIAATLWTSEASDPPGLILVHQLGGDRSDWQQLARDAERSGYTAVAIDMRGHADSAALNPDAPKYRGFSTSDWEGVVHDIDAAKEALLDAGVDASRIGIVGASIGANLAAHYAAEHEDVQALVMLSPGTEYKGVRVAPAFAKYGKRPALLVSGEGDRYSAATCRKLHESAQGFCELREFPGTFHGTALTDSSPNVAGQILQWCDTVLAHASESSQLR